MSRYLPWLVVGGVGALLNAAGLDHLAALGLAGLLVGAVVVARKARV